MSELAVGSLKGLAANDFVIDVAAGSTLNVPPPAILQVIQTVKTNPFTVGFAAGFTPVTGLSATITPSSTASKVLVLANVNFSGDNAATVRIVGADAGDFVGDDSGDRVRGAAFHQGFSTTSNQIQQANATITFLASPVTVSATTFTVELRSTSSNSYVNRASDNQATPNRANTASSITLMEVAG